MAISEVDNITICGIACAVPDNIVKNVSYYNVFDQEVVDKFIKVVGVKERCLSKPQQTAADLCYVAANQLLEKLQWERASIDALIFVTQTPDYRAPATACVLHKRLALSKNCIAFDITLGCSSYVYGIFTAASFLQNPLIKRILVLTGETSTKSNEDQATAMMFGDAGSATAVEQGTDNFRCLLKTDGNGYDKLIAPYGAARNRNCRSFSKICTGGANCSDYSVMDGPAVFDFTLFDVPRAFKEFFASFETTMQDYDYCILHQANLMAMKQIAKQIKLPTEKMPISIDRYGNTSGCSVPLTIATLCESLGKAQNLRLLLSGYGVGLSWGVMSFTIDSKIVLPIIRSNDYFKEAYSGQYRVYRGDVMEEFLELFAEAVDTEAALSMDTDLNTIEEWDSLAYVTFCVLIDGEYKKQLRSTDLRAAQTVRELYDLVQRTKVYED